MSIRKVKTAHDWNSQVEKYSDCLFHSFEWYNALKSPWHKNYLVAYDRHLIPLQINLFTRNAYSGPWGSYGGILGEKEDSLENLKRVKRVLFLKNIYIHTNNSLDFCEPYETSTAVTIPLRSEQENYQFLNENRKRNLRKSMVENLKIDVLTGDLAVRRYIALLKKSRIRYTFHPKACFRKLSKLPQSLFFFCSQGEDLSAALILKLNRETLYYWHGITTDDGAVKHSSELLHWHIILFGISRGFKEYNMGTSPSESLLNYKLSWGGTISRVFTYKI